ncbi:MAG: hypothetical protein IIU30_00330 [Treponema sp.]|nr:hypothetical protein [Treponema sp.]MBQ5431881.1 hypothetical protein [Treponema sp.]
MSQHYEIIYKPKEGSTQTLKTGVMATSAQEAKHKILSAHPTWKIISVCQK